MLQLPTVPVVVKVEVEFALKPNPDETIAELTARAIAAGYTIIDTFDDRVVVARTVEEA